MFRPPRSSQKFDGDSISRRYGPRTVGEAGLDGIGDFHGVKNKYPKWKIYACSTCLLLLVAAAITFAVLQHEAGSSFRGTVPGESVDEVDYARAGFHVDSSIHAVEIDATLTLAKHEATRLQLMTIVPNQHTENLQKNSQGGGSDSSEEEDDAVFGINIRTPLINQHGTAKVVAHALFAGSAEYPVMDLFNQIERGTLQTFIHTGLNKDRTNFVMSSRNAKDFVNIQTVALDAIYQPNLLVQSDADARWMLRQEGWRLEVINNTKVILNGNAINGARQSQTDPHETMIDHAYHVLYPKSPYKYKVRGALSDIPKMTFQEMRDFHRAHYHPTNTQAFCYGSAAAVQRCIDTLSKALDSMFVSPNRRVQDRPAVDVELRKKTAVPFQPLHAKLDNTNNRVPYAANTAPIKGSLAPVDPSVDHRVVTAWTLNDSPMDGRTEVAWMLLEELLLGTPASVLPEAIVHDLEVGTTVNGGLERTLQQWTFVVQVGGLVTHQDKVRAERAVGETLLHVAENGFDEAALDAAMNRLEMRFLDPNPENTPRGVTIFFEVTNKWTYDHDPRVTLKYDFVFQSLKREISDRGPQFLLDLVTKRLIDNGHKTTFELYPSTNLREEQQKEEEDFITELNGKVTHEEGLAMIRETKDLEHRQKAGDSPEALAKIPRVGIEDLNKKAYEHPLKVDKDAFGTGVTVLEHNLPYSNGLAFIDFAIDIAHLDFDDIVLLPLMSRMMMEAGTDRYSAVDFRNEIDSLTGGMEVHPLIEDIIPKSDDNGYYVPDGKHLSTKLVIRGSVVGERGSTTMFNIIRQMLFESNMNNSKKAKQILRALIDKKENQLQTYGQGYAVSRIQSKYSFRGYILEQLVGVSQLMNLRRALHEAETDYDTLASRLITMRDAISGGSRNGMVVSITGSPDVVANVAPGLHTFLRDSLPPPQGVHPFPDFATTEHPWVQKGFKRMQDSRMNDAINEAFVVPTRVNHVGKGGLLFDVGERIRGSDVVVTEYVTGFYLFNELRQRLGAKNAWSLLDLDSGSLIFQTSRDPNILETLEVYEESAAFVRGELDKAGGGSLPAEAIAAIVGTVGALDGSAPPPSQVGYLSLTQYLKQETPEHRQAWRDEILATTREDVLRMTDRMGAWGEPSVVVVTSREHQKQVAAMGLELASCDATGYTC